MSLGPRPRLWGSSVCHCDALFLPVLHFPRHHWGPERWMGKPRQPQIQRHPSQGEVGNCSGIGCMWGIHDLALGAQERLSPGSSGEVTHVRSGGEKFIKILLRLRKCSCLLRYMQGWRWGRHLGWRGVLASPLSTSRLLGSGKILRLPGPIFSSVNGNDLLHSLPFGGSELKIP